MAQTAQSPAEMLAGLDLFAGLSGRQLKKVVGRAREVDHPAGHAVASEGKGGLAFHLILSGTATVTADGREVRRLNPGEYFGEISMIDGRPRSATVTAGEPMRTLAIPHALFAELVEEEPAFARGLLTLLCARLREAEAAS